MTPKDLRARTKKFAVDVIHLCREMPPTIDGKEIGRQLLRAGTSVAANYRGACRGRSHAEFVAKLGIVLEESDETLFWLEIIVESNLKPVARVEKLMNEAGQLTAIFAASLKTAKRNGRAIQR
jgi:four helix bundle protein